MKVRYFASVRQQIGVSEEDVSVNSSIKTVEQLLGFLQSRSDEHSKALYISEKLCFAVDQEMAQLSTLVTEADEVAFFPPVTGG